jgi:hypothetical protein
MTQKEKIQKALTAAMQIKSIANSLEHEAKSYDSTWPLSYSRDLKTISENLLKVL